MQIVYSLLKVHFEFMLISATMNNICASCREIHVIYIKHSNKVNDWSLKLA